MDEIQDAAVLVPVVRPAGRNDPSRIGFALRSPESTTHANHVGFPGGKVEPGDGSLRDTARRETIEELALGAGDVEIVRSLDPHRTRSADFEIVPFLGEVLTPHRFEPASREVTETFWVSVPDLRDAYTMDGDRIRYLVPESDREIWGVTARIVTSLLVAGDGIEFD